MRIVFMGTPDYSLKTLKALYDKGHNVVGVFSQPDKPQGRKQILTPPPVKELANELNIPVFQPDTLKDGKALEIIKKLNPEVIVVVAYGKILPKEILNFPKYGCVNGHASLLPRHRGASPIQWAIVCGDTKTGVTTQLMDEGIDTGKILQSFETDIGSAETAEELFERLSDISAQVVIDTLDKLEKGEIVPIEQDEEKATYTPIIKKDMAKIDFTKTASEVYNAIKGYYSWPCAFFMLDGKRVKVIKAMPAKGITADAGTVLSNDSRLVIACGDNTAIELLTIKPEGSKEMSSKEFLCGKKIPLGTKVI